MLASPNNIQTLQSWNFLDTLKRHEDDILELARLAYASAKYIVGNTPTPGDCLAFLADVHLTYSTTWNHVLLHEKAHMPPSLRPLMTNLMARYVLDRYWDTIEA